MIEIWRRGLAQRGARIHDYRAEDFEPASVASADAAVTLTPLLGEGLILASGEDARDFLQGQLSNDVSEVTATRGQLAAYCTPKGRVLATLTVWQWKDGYVLQVPRALAEPIGKRLRMYVLRSRVNLEDISDQIALIGATGAAVASLSSQIGNLPQAAYEVVSSSDLSVLALPGDRIQVALNADAALAVWDRLAALGKPAGQDLWDWHGITAGVPVVTAPASDQFLPQMLNLHLVGGVSFRKGCYTGQEIVARAQYLGQVKRRLSRFSTAEPTAAGAAIYTEGQAVGMVVNAAPAPAGGYELLVVVPADPPANTFTLDASGGTQLTRLSLPYPEADAQMQPAGDGGS